MIGSGWKLTAITRAIGRGLVSLESLDPFAAIDPLEHGSTVPLIKNGNLDQFDISSFVTHDSNEDDGDEWLLKII